MMAKTSDDSCVFEQMENVYIRGSHLRFLVLPDMLKNAPMFKTALKKNAGTAASAGGKAAILRAQAAKRTTAPAR